MIALRRRVESGRVDHERGDSDRCCQRGSVQPSVEVEHRVHAWIGQARLERDCAGDGVAADRDLVRVDGSGERRDFATGHEVERGRDLFQSSGRVGGIGRKGQSVFGAERRVDGDDDVAVAREVLRERGRQRHR